jgi:hypothetical protein
MTRRDYTALKIYAGENSELSLRLGQLAGNSLVAPLTRISSRVKSNAATFSSDKINTKIIAISFAPLLIVFLVIPILILFTTDGND